MLFRSVSQSRYRSTIRPALVRAQINPSLTHLKRTENACLSVRANENVVSLVSQSAHPANTYLATRESASSYLPKYSRSLCSSFLPDRLVCLPVKHPYAITLYDRLPIGLRVPLEASVTLLEATTPVKLPTIQCPPIPGVRIQIIKGPYFNVGSTNTGVPAS